MNRSFRLMTLATLALAALCGAARADVALDYHAKVKGCPSPDRFADEVSAKLGFVPWDAQAAAAIRVRITQDGPEIVGTIEQPDDTSKVLRAASCTKLAESLVSTIAVALDRPATTGAPATPRPDDRRLRSLERDAPDRLVTIELQSKDGRELEVSRVLSSTVLYGGYNRRAAAVQFEKLCKAPCAARLPQGTHTFLVRDIANDYTVSQDATIRVSSTLELDYTSRAEPRRITSRRSRWGLAIGFVTGTVATAYLVETELVPSTSRALHSFDLLGGVVGSAIGALIGYAVSPGMPADETRITVRPGLGTTTAGY